MQKKKNNIEEEKRLHPVHDTIPSQGLLLALSPVSTSSTPSVAAMPRDATYGQLDNMPSIECHMQVWCAFCLPSIHMSKKEIWESWKSVLALLISSPESFISEYFSDMAYILFVGSLVWRQSCVVSHTGSTTSFHTVIPNFFTLQWSDLPQIDTCILE